MLSFKHSERGSIIAFTLIILALLLTSGLAVVTVGSLEQKSGLVSQKSVMAFQAADSGAERLLERIYIDNSPSLLAVPANTTLPGSSDATPSLLARNLLEIATDTTSCDSANKITATSRVGLGYKFEVTLYDGNDAIVDCTDTAWRDKVVRMRVEGFYRQTARVIEMGINPRPKCTTGETVAYSGVSYPTLLIGEQCWLRQNMQVGAPVIAPAAQPNDGSIQKYCWNNQAVRCTQNNPDVPDGGLYTWDEAMQYASNEGAKGICPTGWHIPTKDDWATLADTLDSSITPPLTVSAWNGTTIGTTLKPPGSSNFEFNLAGKWTGSWDDRDTSGYLWSSTANDSTSSRYYKVTASGIDAPKLFVGNLSKSTAASVRCIMD